jgi:hypothetical protein
MSLPKQLAAKSKAHKEKNDCAVKAIAIVANASYEEAHEALAKQGRRNGRGSTIVQIMAALKSLGVHVNGYINHVYHGGKNMGRCPIRDVTFRLRSVYGMDRKQIAERRFLVLTRNHILAVKDGEVQDWTEGRRHQARFAWEVSL